jgi:hypothetical protein
MRLFLGTVKVDEIRQAARMGVPAGVITTPALMAKESGVTHRERVIEIVMHAVMAALHVAIVPFAGLQAVLKHPLTDSGIERFVAILEDMRPYERVPAQGHPR